MKWFICLIIFTVFTGCNIVILNEVVDEEWVEGVPKQLEGDWTYMVHTSDIVEDGYNIKAEGRQLSVCLFSLKNSELIDQTCTSKLSLRFTSRGDRGYLYGYCPSVSDSTQLVFAPFNVVYSSSDLIKLKVFRISDGCSHQPFILKTQDEEIERYLCQGMNSLAYLPNETQMAQLRMSSWSWSHIYLIRHEVFWMGLTH